MKQVNNEVVGNTHSKVMRGGAIGDVAENKVKTR